TAPIPTPNDLSPDIPPTRTAMNHFAAISPRASAVPGRYVRSDITVRSRSTDLQVAEEAENEAVRFRDAEAAMSPWLIRQRLPDRKALLDGSRVPGLGIVDFNDHERALRRPDIPRAFEILLFRAREHFDDSASGGKERPAVFRTSVPAF